MRFTKRRRLISALESTAMADIIFLLLIFFLLSSSFILQTGIKVELPQVAQVEKQVQKDVIVTITAEEDVHLNGVPTPWKRFRQDLQSLLEASATKTVVIKGDQDVRLGRTVQVMDVARQLGASQLAIAARPLAAQEGEESNR